MESGHAVEGPDRDLARGRRERCAEPRGAWPQLHAAGTARNPVHTVAIHALMDLEADMVAPRGMVGDADRAEVERAHAALLAAVEAHDGARARAVMEAHIADMQRRVAARASGS